MPKIVIDVPDEFYNHIMNDNAYFLEDGEALHSIVQDGTVLPKGHGRLIDGTEMLHRLEDWKGTNRFTRERILEAPTIVEADKEKQ